MSSNSKPDDSNKYNVIILAVAHDQYVNKPEKDLARLLASGGIIYDLKNVVSPSFSDIRL